MDRWADHRDPKIGRVDGKKNAGQNDDIESVGPWRRMRRRDEDRNERGCWAASEDGKLNGLARVPGVLLLPIMPPLLRRIWKTRMARIVEKLA